MPLLEIALFNPLPMTTALFSLAMLAACASKSQITVFSSDYADGISHTEPVFYNDKHYDVTFRYNAGSNAYDVTVAGKGGRRLGDKQGDQAIIENIAASAVTHFACANGQRSNIVPGATRHNAGRWDTQAKCA